MRTSTNPLRSEFEMIRWAKNYMKENNVPRTAGGAIRICRDRIREMNKRRVDRLEKSISEDWREIVHGDGIDATVSYYRIFKYSGEPEEEIREFIRDMEVHNNSPYDCSGKLCTMWIDWKVTPAGLAVVHHMCLDV